jgi:uncharacterized protein YdaU (DUF1376 family)
MSQAPSMPVFTDALIGDTTDLSMEEFGAYLMILFVTWRNNGQPLADDDMRMARICRMSESEWAAIKPTISRFFDITEGFWRQKRLEKEWAFVQKRIEVKKANGKKGGRPKSLKDNETDKAVGSVELNLDDKLNESTHTHTQESKEDTEAKASGANAANAPQALQAVVIDLFPVEEHTPAQMMWGTYLHELADMTGKSTKDPSLRKLLGQWSKAYGGEQAVCEAISDASARQPPLADPVPWIIATLKTRKNGNERNRPQKPNSGWFEFGCELAQGGLG